MKILDELLMNGYSKHRIRKELGVSWNTVRRWELGTSSPTEENGMKLLDLLNRGEK